MNRFFSLKKMGAFITSAIIILTGVFASATVTWAATFLVPDTVPSGRIGVAYSQAISGNSMLEYNWSVRSGSLPPGLTGVSSSNGVTYTISGTPTMAGSYTFNLGTTRRDGAGMADAPNRTYTLVVTAPLTITTAPSLPNGNVSSAYSQTVAVSGGVTPYNWRLGGGSLPPGLTLYASTGVISGTPTATGSYSFTVKVGDANLEETARTFTIMIDPALPVFTPGTPIGTLSTDPVIASSADLPAARVGVAYGADLVGTAGTAPYRWSVSYGSSLPAGLALTTVGNDGQIRGTPTASGSYTFSVKLLDSRDRSSTKSFNLTVAPAETSVPSGVGPTITSSSLPTATVAASYAASLSASGGTPPYSWNFASGTLPPGLTLGTDGVIRGTPTTAGTYTMYLEVFDAARAYSGRNFTITVNAAASGSGTGTGAGTGSSIDLSNRLAAFTRIGVSVHNLVKLPDDGNRFTQADSAVYYLGADGRRHAFPNDRVYFTWYSDFAGVRVISSADLAAIPLGANVTYRPGVKMVKFLTDPKVYAVSNNRSLRWVKTEAAAQGLYGSTWNRQIDDIADTFYLDYTFGADINVASDFSISGVQAAVRYVSDVLPL